MQSSLSDTISTISTDSDVSGNADFLNDEIDRQRTLLAEKIDKVVQEAVKDRPLVSPCSGGSSLLHAISARQRVGAAKRIEKQRNIYRNRTDIGPVVSYVNSRVEYALAGLGDPKCNAVRSSTTAASVTSLTLDRKLTGHTGCVNALNFSPDGSLLISGSDDTHLIVWSMDGWHNKDGGKSVIKTKHEANIFQTKFLFHCANDQIVTSGLDGQVFHVHLGGGGGGGSSRSNSSLSSQSTCRRLTSRQEAGSAVHKIALNFAGSPLTFLSANENGTVSMFDLRRSKASSALANTLASVVTTYGNPFSVRKNSRALRPMTIYSIDINPMRPHEFCLAGEDEWIRVVDSRRLTDTPIGSPFVRGVLQDFGECNLVRVFCPLKYMKPAAKSKLADLQGFVVPEPSDDDMFNKTSKGSATCAVYSKCGNFILASYRMDRIVLFENRASNSNIDREIQSYSGHINIYTIKSVNFYGQHDEFVVSGSDCGRIFIWDAMSGAIVTILGSADERGAINVLEPHPSLPVLATSGLDDEVKIWQPSHLECATAGDATAIVDGDKVELIVRRNANHILRPLNPMPLSRILFPRQTEELMSLEFEESIDGFRLAEHDDADDVYYMSGSSLSSPPSFSGFMESDDSHDGLEEIFTTYFNGGVDSDD